MNLESILPLLMKNGGGDNAAMLSALSGDKSKLLEGFMGKDPKSKELFSMFNMMQGGGQKPQKSPPMGLKAIYNFAPKDILGIMVKYYSR